MSKQYHNDNELATAVKIASPELITRHVTWANRGDPADHAGATFFTDLNKLAFSDGTNFKVPLKKLTGVIDTIIVGDSMIANHNSVLAISSAVRSANVVTVTTSVSHGMYTGMEAGIQNCVPSDFNSNRVAITRTGPTTVTYPSIGADGSATALLASPSKPMIAINLSWQSDKFIYWLQSISKGAFNIINNAGASGQTSVDILARFDNDVLTYSTAKLVVLRLGYNDFVGFSYTADAVYANVVTMIDKCINAGMYVLVVGCMPWGTGGTDANRGEAVRYNKLVDAYCSTKEGALFADPTYKLIDNTSATKFFPLTNMLVDGTHGTPRGEKKVAEVVWDAISKYVTSPNRLVTSSADNYGFNALSKNIYDSGYWDATGGTVVAPVTGTMPSTFRAKSSATGTWAVSAFARADGIGYDVVGQCTPAAASDYLEINHLVNISATRFTIGQKLRLLCEISLAGVVGSNFKGVDSYIAYSGAGGSAYATLSAANLALNYPQEDQIITVVGENVVIPEGTTSISVFHVFSFFGAGTMLTVKVGRVSLIIT